MTYLGRHNGDHRVYKVYDLVFMKCVILYVPIKMYYKLIILTCFNKYSIICSSSLVELVATSLIKRMGFIYTIPLDAGFRWIVCRIVN